ncbi:MAG: transcription antitermination factor NusB [Pseudomonadota bacterium]
MGLSPTARQQNKERGPLASGWPTRHAAGALIYTATVEKSSLEGHSALQGLSEADAAFASAIALSAFRRLPTIDRAIQACLAKPLPPGAGRLMAILRTMAAQLLLLDTEPYAAVNCAVDDARSYRETLPFAALVNAVGRRMAKDTQSLLADAPDHDLPAWLAKRWVRAYGADAFGAIAEQARQRPGLDLTVAEPAERPQLEAALAASKPLAIGPSTIRLETAHSAINQLPGYADGQWWVQDLAASLPALLLLDATNKAKAQTQASPQLRLVDACAAPGGKTAQLAISGASVTAIDSSDQRMQRLNGNMQRLGLNVDCVISDARAFSPKELFDGALIDAPCTATGTIRRHPEIGPSRSTKDIRRLAALQSELLANARHWLKPGGVLTYATCSLEPEEGEHQIAAFLQDNDGWELIDLPQWAREFSSSSNPAYLRTLPGQAGVTEDGRQWRGLDGFFCACLHKPVDY